MNYLELNYPRFDVNESGEVFKDGKLLKPFKSNGYKQVVLVDKNNIKKAVGVHCIVAMKYLNYYSGCNVHHKDHIRSNNNLSNLEVKSRKGHSSEHSKENTVFYTLNKGKPAWNRGKKMSEDFCKKCSDSAKKRGFQGNKFVDKQGNRR